tara:strand:+ start:5673 stop:6767 length:1095 start_codon:yes stop_codon:yes gene_type:complete
MKYFNPVKIVKTKNWLSELKLNLEELKISDPVIITTDGNNDRLDLDSIFNSKNIYTNFSNNPTINDCKQVINYCQNNKFNGVVSIGGGSAMDLAKVVMAHLSSGLNNIYDLLSPSIDCRINVPSIFLPTTHGTASEVTMWGTIWDMENKKKYSISNVSLYPDIAILDGSLTLTLPLEISISTTLDALSHAFESIWNKNSNDESSNYAIESISCIIKNSTKLKNTPLDIGVRTKLLEASTLAGLAFSNTKTAASHSISYPLTINYNIPHGIAASITLLPILDINRKFIKHELDVILNQNNITYQQLKNIIFDIPQGIVPFNLKEWGVKSDGINQLVSESFTKGRMDNNIVDLEIGDVENILKSIL